VFLSPAVALLDAGPAAAACQLTLPIAVAASIAGRQHRSLRNSGTAARQPAAARDGGDPGSCILHGPWHGRRILAMTYAYAPVVMIELVIE
jgi:hypothetical protein